jgi:hypothetical protein
MINTLLRYALLGNGKVMLGNMLFGYTIDILLAIANLKSLIGHLLPLL